MSAPSKSKTADIEDASKESTDDLPRRSFVDQMKFLKAYWVSKDEKWKARAMLGGVIGLTIAEIALTAGVGFGFQAALTALVAKNATALAWSGGATVAGLVASNVAGNGRQTVAANLSQNWRGWLTRQFNEAWLGDKSYLRLQHQKNYGQNPDQRIAETVSNVANSTLFLGLGAFRSAVALVTFSAVLWHIAPLMLGAAVLCAAGAHVATHMAGGPFYKLWGGVMNAEGKFRHALSRIRDNSKTVALAGHEGIERETLREKFDKVDAERRKINTAAFKTGVVSQLSANTATIVPIALSIPKFFAGTATLGTLELTRQAYSQVYNALNWFPQGYSDIASWRANTSQLMQFQSELEENKRDMLNQESRATDVVLNETPGSDKVIFRNVALKGVDGQPLVNYGNVTFSPGDRVMLSGPAGCGKSAGLAAMRSAWLLGGTGEISVPPELRFVTQEEYFPDRTLRGMLCAPKPASHFSTDQVVQAMKDAGLERFIPDLDDDNKRGEYWKNTLSGGQKNRVSFAGAFLHAPETKVLIVDEITAALDAKSEAELYPKLLDRLKHGIVISVAHHSTLAPLHNVSAKVADGKVTYSRMSDVSPDVSLDVSRGVPPGASLNDASGWALMAQVPVTPGQGTALRP